MNSITHLIERFPVVTFCTLAVLLSYASYFLAIPREALPFVLVVIPAVLAIALVAFTEGGTAVRALLGQLGRWRVGIRWTVVAIAVALAMRLAVGLLALLLDLIPSIPLLPQNPMQVTILALVYLVAAVLEEVGWRGFALTRLLAWRSPIFASLVLGIPWGLIHVTLHFPGMWAEGLPWWPTILQLISLSAVITWLFVSSGRSILLVSLFHAAQSAFGYLNEGMAQIHVLWLMTAVWSATAALVLIAMAGRSRTRKSLAPAA